MFVSECLGVNKNGHLTIGEKDTLELAETYGTPLYVMDERQIRKNCVSYRESIRRFYGGNGMAAFASKAFCCKAMCQIAKEEGLGLDVVSAGEIYTALAADFPMERVLFHGNNKTPAELTLAIENGVGRIVVDNLFELELVNQIAKAADTTVNIQFRVKPGVGAHTHEFIRTGQLDSKFGLALETGEAFEAIRQALEMKNLHVAGIHCHIGSQIFEVEPFELAAQRMLGLIAKVKNDLGFVMEELNLGGGFGIPYLPEDNPVPYGKYMELVSGVVKDTCQQLDIPMPFIIMEPGRSIVASAGITLYHVGAVKEIPDIRTYVSVDGGMTDNPRYALYQAKYDMLIANKATQPKSTQVTVAGKCCESGDLLGEHVAMQPVAVGDVLAVLATGAYNYSMSSNYNRVPRPAVVMVNGQDARVVVRRETLEDIIRNDL